MRVPIYYRAGGFPPSELNWSNLITLVGKANAAVARYEGLLSAIPNASALMSPLTTQEAVLSSRVEGTQATMGEVLEYEAKGETTGSSSPKETDIQEILNYRKAMRVAESMLQELPLSQRVIREAHKVLLSGVRGHGRSPGEYRKIPNWIGSHGCTIEEARFVPIAADKLPDAMSVWEHFVHAEYPDRLVQLALLHAEFEALHPFLDGNGRLGRMLIPLFMCQTGLIQRPMFYISAFLEANRDVYYDKLLAVSCDNDWTGWCHFFLMAVQQQAEENFRKASAIQELYNQMKTYFIDITRSQHAIHALDWIFDTPIFSSTDFVRCGNIPVPTAKRILMLLKKDGVIKEFYSGSGRRPTIFGYPELLNIAEGHNVF